ncbi:MAG: hypothetical protein ACAH59_13530 [Pseudobdellovibrionaceae bacterium]
MSSQPIAFYRTKVAVAIVAACALGFALFQNCAKVAATDLNNSDPQAIKENIPPEVEDLIKNCADAKATGRISVLKTQVNFTNNEKCQWGINDNWEGNVQNRLSARKERYVSAVIPADAVVCNVKMDNFQEQVFKYDDNIFLTLNDFILASTANYSEHLQSQNGFYKYDWIRLRDNMKDKRDLNDPSDSLPEKQYCAGKADGLSDCLFPQTQATGRILLSFNERVIQNVLGMTNPQQVKVGMITTGDNDDASDCQSSPINLNLDIEYYRK